MKAIFINNDQAGVKQNIEISGFFKYASNDYGADFTTTDTVNADINRIVEAPINGDAVLLRNTNGTDENRIYVRAANTWEALPALTIASESVTLAKLATTSKTNIFSYQVEDLSAGGDIADRVIFVSPSGLDVTLVSASIIPQGSSAGIDDSNTCVIKLSDGTNTIVEATYDADPAFPAAAAVTSLGALSETYKVLSASEKLYLSVTNGATANPPAFMLQVVYTVADAA